jgi:hypothetical protein
MGLSPGFLSIPLWEFLPGRFRGLWRGTLGNANKSLAAESMPACPANYPAEISRQGLVRFDIADDLLSLLFGHARAEKTLLLAVLPGVRPRGAMENITLWVSGAFRVLLNPMLAASHFRSYRMSA